jgi:hypothetical protein
MSAVKKPTVDSIFPANQEPKICFLLQLRKPEIVQLEIMHGIFE